MEALVWLGGDRLVIEDLPSEIPHADETLFDVSLAGICGSDLHAYRGAGGKRVPPLVLGHEAVGRIKGDDRLFVVLPLQGCGHCARCLSGQENLCSDRLLLGLDRPGTFAQEVVVPTSALVAVPDGLSADVAALTEPLATSLAAFKGLELGPDVNVAVIGCGSIGLLAIYAAALSGCHVVAADPMIDRHATALELGAATVVSSAEEFAPGSADIVVDAVGYEATWSAGLRTVRAGGDVVIVGLGQFTGSVEIGDLVRRGVSFRGSYAYTRKDFEEALAMLATAPPSVGWLDRVPLREGAAAFASLAGQTTNAVKILLQPAGVTD
ncbi:MAG TPA: alcohol dehydrogenase catalytic domain-containing protein [Acidimicrobiales bacterium]|nr:alcohol dehydrogenase catalytic domain-containing protein [Acidimicrobiales bacterium]